MHPDLEEKLITMIHYFADFGDDKSLGTKLYTPLKEGKNLSVLDDIITSAPYLPNSVCIFSPSSKVGSATNHSYLNTSKQVMYRKSIQTFYLNSKQNWKNAGKSGRIML